MTLSELTADQRIQLKQQILVDRNEAVCEGTSYEELANADELVSDEDLEACYADTEFSPDDFTPSDAERDWEKEALRRAEATGVYEYYVNGKYMEYWSFYGREGWYFVRYDLEAGKEVFRGANIPWDDEAQIPSFLKTEDGATKYNYMEG